ncbi:gluconokinase [Celeribacter sp.]|uniref:gluconokinase n=1 Tax=Celeribacter sp. TaxID=1890673 RepID=UPI003A917B2A
MADIIIVAGVSGSGKTTLAETLAAHFELPFLEGDDFHPPQNVVAMAAGTPLTDEMRAPWLDRLGQAARDAGEVHGGAIVSCSSLKRSYRDLLREGTGGCRFVLLNGDRDLILDRMAKRENHYMPTALLDSQIATLEPPEPDESDLIEVSVDATPEQIATRAIAALEKLDAN